MFAAPSIIIMYMRQLRVSSLVLMQAMRGYLENNRRYRLVQGFREVLLFHLTEQLFGSGSIGFLFLFLRFRPIPIVLFLIKVRLQVPSCIVLGPCLQHSTVNTVQFGSYFTRLNSCKMSKRPPTDEVTNILWINTTLDKMSDIQEEILVITMKRPKPHAY